MEMNIDFSDKNDRWILIFIRNLCGYVLFKGLLRGYWLYVY